MVLIQLKSLRCYVFNVLNLFFLVRNKSSIYTIIHTIEQFKEKLIILFLFY